MTRDHGSLASRLVHLFAPDQPDLFAPREKALAPLPVRARDSDPQPSHEAASLVERKGIATAQGREILAELRRHPEGLTADALDFLLFSAATYAVAAKRLPELEAKDLVSRAAEKRETRSGVRATVWRLMS